MRILFVREKYADGDPGRGPSDGNYMIRTWQERNTADTWRSFFYDDRGEANINAELAELDMNWYPDVVMFSHLLSWGEKNISKDTWEAIRRHGAKVVGVWHEGIAPDVVRVADEHADCVDLNLFLDTKTQFLNYTKRPEKCFGLYDPRSPEVFKPAEKCINVFFNGTLKDRNYRVQGLACLLTPQNFGINARGIGVTKIGGRDELFVPEDQMIDLLSQARICINYSDAGQQFKHYKGRVAEALLCGCLLMEWTNDETSNLLIPFKDFVPFDTPQDLYNKVKHYLSFPAERERIAEAGRKTALELLDGRMFWAELFQKLGLQT